MLFTSWMPYSLKNSAARQHSAARRRGHRRHPRLPTIALLVEALESRQLLTDIFVTTTDDAVVSDSVTSLREAVLQANASNDSAFIYLGSGTFTLTMGAGDDVGAVGDLDIFNPNYLVTIIGAGHDQTIIDGGGLDRVFHILPGAVVRLENLTIQGGQTTESGGGIRNEGSLSLTGVKLLNNVSGSEGGAIWNSVSGVLNVDGSRIAMNQAATGGAAIFNLGLASINGSLVIDNSQPTPSSPGTPSGVLTNVGSQAQMTVIASEVVGGAGSLDVGGLHNQGGTVEILRSTFNNNAGWSVGGVFNESGTMLIQNSTFANNNGNQVGAIRNDATLSVVHATVMYNSAQGDTGGIFSGPNATSLLQNSIVAGSQTNQTPGPDLSGPFNSSGSNLIGIAGSVVGLNLSQGDQFGTSAMPLDPRLLPLGDYSRDSFSIPKQGLLVPPMLTFLPMEDSPAIDAANPGNGPAVDQYGHPRPTFAGVAFASDIGAVERFFGTLRGRAFDDRNGNNEQDDGEPIVSDFLVRLTNSPLLPGVEPTFQTNGLYEFALLPQSSELFLKFGAPPEFLPPIAPLGMSLLLEESLNDPSVLLNAITVGDVNGDGLPDVVTGGISGGNDAVISVFLMNVEGLFSEPTIITMPGQSTVLAVALADFNNDEHLDLAATTAGQVFLYENNGDGTFQLRTTASGMGQLPSLLVTGDFNNDGKLDFAIADQPQGTLNVRFTDGDFGISNGLRLVQGGVIADLLAGPTGELLVTNSGLGTVTLLRATPLGGFTQDFNITGLANPRATEVADFLGDGVPDLVVATDNGLLIFTQIEQQGASPIATFTINIGADELLARDFDQDLLADIAVTNSEGQLILLRSLGNGNFEPTFSQTFGLKPGTLTSIQLPRIMSVGGNFDSLPSNGQQKSDLVALSLSGQSFKIFGNTSGLFPVAVSDAATVTFDLPLVRAAVLNGQVQLTNGSGQTTPLPGVRVYVDRNQNQRYDVGETFTFSAQDDFRTSTNEAGQFSLKVRPGDHLLRVDPPQGYVVVSPNNMQLGNVFALTVSNGEVVNGLDFQLAIPAGPNSAPTTPSDADTLANSIPEGALNGSRVGITLRATDPDGNNVFYRLTDDAGGRFVIDPLTGVVTVKQGQLLVAANATQHTIKAQAVDSAGLASAEVEFVIQVTAVPANALPIATILPNRVDVVEGDQGPRFVNFQVQLNKASTQTITIDFSTFVGSDPNFQLPEGIDPATPFATDNPAAPDFFRTSGRLTFAPGVTEQSLRVQIAPDNLPEANELFFVQLRSPVNAQLSTQQRVAIARILDDDSFPQLVVADTRSLEGDTPGQNELVFTVQLVGDFPPGVSQATVDFSTGNPVIDNAVAGTDYTFQSGTLTFTDATRIQEVHVPIIGNLLDESDKTVSLRFTNELGLGLSRSEVRGTIVNDDSPNVVLSISSQVVRELNAGKQSVELVVTLVGKPTGTVTVNFATENGSATAGTDFRARSGTLEFAPGEIQKSIFVTVLGDTLVEQDEVFTVNLSLPAGLPQPNIAISPENGVGKVVIRNDDQAVLTEDGDALVEQLTADLTAILNLGGGVKNNPTLIAEMQRRAVLIAQQLGLTKAIIIIIDPVDFVLNDAENRQSGYTANTGVVNQIPGTYYSGDGAVELLIVPTPPDGTYNVQLAGIGGDFNASITVIDGNQATTTTVSSSLANGSTLNVAVQVGNANIPRAVGLGLAAANASAGVGVIGSLGNQGLELALARAMEQSEAEIWNLDNSDLTPLDRIFALFTIAARAGNEFLEGLRLSLESPFGDLIEWNPDLREALPAVFLDLFWQQLGQTLLGVPAGAYRIGDMLEMIVPTNLRARSLLRNSPPGDQAPMPNGTGARPRPRTRTTRSSFQRTAPAPVNPPTQPTKKSEPSPKKSTDSQNTSSPKAPPTSPNSDTALFERLWNLWLAPPRDMSPTSSVPRSS